MSGCAAIDLPQVGASAFCPLLLRHISLGELIIGRRDIGIQLESLSKGSYSARIVLQLVQRRAKLHVRASGLGIELDGLFQRRLGFLIPSSARHKQRPMWHKPEENSRTSRWLAAVRYAGVVILGVERLLARVEFLPGIVRDREVSGGNGGIRWHRSLLRGEPRQGSDAVCRST